MDYIQKVAMNLYEKNLLRFVPWRFLKQYVYPHTIRKTKTPCETDKYWESYYQSFGSKGITDEVTLAYNIRKLDTLLHYNATENSIISAFLNEKNLSTQSVLDIGSGAGHWIDFYRNHFPLKSIMALELTQKATDHLCLKYKNYKEVSIIRGNIANENLEINTKFNLINAVGVMFHIVEDYKWKQALINLKRLLAPEGIIVIGGQFGFLTQNVQFNSTNEFDSLEGLALSTGSDQIYYNKRIRSLKYWKRMTRKAGLKVERKIKTRNDYRIITPENNILILKHAE